MTTVDNYWQLLTTIDNYWQLLTTIDNCWQLLTTIDDYWWLLKGLMMYGQHWLLSRYRDWKRHNPWFLQAINEEEGLGFEVNTIDFHPGQIVLEDVPVIDMQQDHKTAVLNRGGKKCETSDQVTI